MNKTEVVEVLRSRVETCGSLKSFAKQHGISVQFVCDVLKGRRDLTDRLLTAIGVKKVVTYERIETNGK